MRKYIARMPIEDGVRSELLKAIPPVFENVYAKAITIAYGVDASFKIGDESFGVDIYGIHRDFDTQALLCAVAGMYTQDSLQAYLGNQPAGLGVPLHLTISTAPGVPPARAGLIKGGCITYFDKTLYLGVKPVLELVGTTSPALLGCR